MSDLAVRWVALAPSAWQRRLRCGAIAVSAAVLASLLVVRVSGSGLAALVAATVALVGASMAAHFRAPRPDTRKWRVAPDGTVSIRFDDEICRDAAVVFVSPAFIVLRVGRRSLEIWRDATPVPAFRRLSVAVRWRTRHRPAASLTVVNPSDAAERT